MREVLDERDAVDLVAHFEAALDAFETGESCRDGFFLDALAGGEGRGGRGVEDVVLAGEVHRELGPVDAAAIDLPLRLPVHVTQIADAPAGGIAEAIALHAAEGTAHALGDVVAAVVGHDNAAARNQIDEALEGGFDGVEIAINVGVVELHVGEDERVGKVVEEFGAFVKKCGVVLVAFDDEGLRGAKLEARAEVLRNAADQKRGLQCGILARGGLPL